jgi:hypothetical protein
VALRPARLLPPKRLLTPRSARCLSTTNRGLLPGAPAITRAGLAPAGLVQFSGRNIPGLYGRLAQVMRFVTATVDTHEEEVIVLLRAGEPRLWHSNSSTGKKPRAQP